MSMRPASAMVMAGGRSSASPVSHHKHSSKQAWGAPRAPSAHHDVAHTPTARPARAASAGPRSGNQGHPAPHNLSYLQEQLQAAMEAQAVAQDEHQRRVVRYRHTLRALHDDNATLRNIIADGERRRRHGEETQATAAASVSEAEIQHLEMRINVARQKRNRLSHEIETAAAALQKVKDEGEELIAMAEASLGPAELLLGANRSLYLRIRRLEHLLNDVLRKQSTVGVILKNYHYHRDVLHDAANHHDVEMKLLRREYADKHRDHLLLLELFRKGQKAHSGTVHATEHFHHNSAKVRAAKEKALQQKKKSVDESLRHTQALEHRVADLQRDVDEEAQLLDAAEEQQEQLQQQRRKSREGLALLGTASGLRTGDGGEGDDAASEERVAAYEQAFEEMMQEARVDNFDALVHAYEEEVQEQIQLQEKVEAARDQHAAAAEELRMLKQKMEETKYSTSSSAARAPIATTLMETEMNQFLAERLAEEEATAASSAACQQTLYEVADRVNQLAALLSAYRADVQIPVVRRTPAITRRASTLPLHTAVLAQKLLALADDAAATASSAVYYQQEAYRMEGQDATALAPGASSSSAAATTAQVVIPANNLRVRLPLKSHQKRNIMAHASVGAFSAEAARRLLSQRTEESSPHSNRDGVPMSGTDRRRYSTSTTSDADANATLLLSTENGAGGFFLDGSDAHRDHLLHPLHDEDDDEDGDAYEIDDEEEEKGGEREGNGVFRHRTSNGSGQGGGPSGARRRQSSLRPLGGAGGGRGEEDDSNGAPLRREEVKAMSAAVQERAMRRAQRELERR